MGASYSSQQVIDLSTAYNINNQTQGAKVIGPYPYLQRLLSSSCFTKLSRASLVPPFRQTFTSRRGIRLAYSFPGTSTVEGGIVSEKWA